MNAKSEDYLLQLRINIKDTPEQRLLIQRLLHGSDTEKALAKETIKTVTSDWLVYLVEEEAIKKGL